MVYDLLDFSEIPNRKPYVHNGRQIEGSLTVSGTTYLVELKFTSEQADATDIDTFHKKVTTKADNTMASWYRYLDIHQWLGKRPRVKGPRFCFWIMGISTWFWAVSWALAISLIECVVMRHKQAKLIFPHLT